MEALDGIESMTMEKLQKKLHKMMREDPGQSEKPHVEHYSFIPSQLRSNVLVMKAEPLNRSKMVTLFVGTIRVNYTDMMWREDVDQWKKHFGPEPHNTYFEIDLLPVRQATGETLDQMNSRDAIPKIEQAMVSLNQVEKESFIRIVCLGTGFSQFLYEAIQFILSEWKNPDGTDRKDKHLQFVTSGDTKNNDLCSFCRWLCVSGVCKTVEFYNTKEYHPFGYCAASYK